MLTRQNAIFRSLHTVRAIKELIWRKKPCNERWYKQHQSNADGFFISSCFHIASVCCLNVFFFQILLASLTRWVCYAKNPSAEKFLYILWQLYAGANQKIKSYRRTEMIALSGKLHQHFFGLIFRPYSRVIFFSLSLSLFGLVKELKRPLDAWLRQPVFPGRLSSWLFITSGKSYDFTDAIRLFRFTYFYADSCIFLQLKQINKKILSQIHETMDRTAHVSRMVYAAFEFKIILARFLIF